MWLLYNIVNVSNDTILTNGSNKIMLDIFYHKFFLNEPPSYKKDMDKS